MSKACARGGLLDLVLQVLRTSSLRTVAGVPVARTALLYSWKLPTSSRKSFVCSVRTIHHRNPQAARFPTMYDACAAAHINTVRTLLTF